MFHYLSISKLTILFSKGMLIEKLGWQNLAAPLDYINLHVRGGIVIPMQEPEECLTTVCS